MKKINIITVFLLLLISLFCYTACNNISNDDREYYILQLEEKIRINERIEDYEPTSLTYQERLRNIKKLVESEYTGDFKLSPQIGFCSNQLLINNERNMLRVLLDYTPINQDVELRYSYKKDNKYYEENAFCNESYVYEIEHIPSNIMFDTLNLFYIYRDKYMFSAFGYNVIP